MQSYDVHDQLIQAQMLEMSELRAAIERDNALGAVKHIIAVLPDIGEVIEIRGLEFKVEDIDLQTGRLQLKLVGTA